MSSADPKSLSGARLDYLRYILAALFLAYGLYTSGLFDRDVDRKWIVLTILLYLAVLAAQRLPGRGFQVAALWVGAFLALQSLVSPWILAQTKDFKTLPLMMDRRLEVEGIGVPGVHGLQHVTTDHKGFRVKPGIDYDAKAEYRIFAIGGSTTEQLVIDDTRTWAHLLQLDLSARLDTPVGVINTGVSGLRAAHHLATLEKSLAYQPDLALFLLGVNDWNKQIREHFGSDGYRQPDHLFRESLLGKAVDWVYEWGKRSWGTRGEVSAFTGDYFLSQRGSLERADQRAFLPERVTDDYLTTLDRISDTCHRAKLLCVFATQPSGYALEAQEELLETFWMTPPNESYSLTLESMVHIAEIYNRELIDFGRRRGHPVIDLADEVAPSLENLSDDVHFNLQGSRRVAQVFAPALAAIIRAGPTEP